MVAKTIHRLKRMRGSRRALEARDLSRVRVHFFLVSAILVYLIGSLLLIRELRKTGKLSWHPYDTTNCRDVRAQLDMICPKSRLEYIRKCVNNKTSKF